MKKALFPLAALVLVASCSNDFVINGTVDGNLAVSGSTFVSLMDNTGEEVARIPVENGKFTYTLPVDVTTCYSLVLPTGTGNSIISLIADKSKAKVHFGPDGADVTGSKLSKEFNDLYDTFRELTDKANEDMSEALEADDDEAAEAIELKFAEDLVSTFTEPYLKNKDNYVGLNALHVLFEYLDYDEAADLYEKGGEIIHNDEDINRSLEAKKAEKDTSVGCKFIDISGLTAGGEEIKLSDYVGRGDYVLVDFWASWCGPCMRAVPNARALLEKYGPKGFQLLGVNCWERQEGAGQLKAVEMNMTWPVIFAEDSAPAAYGIEAIPTLILFGPDGTIVERLLGEAGLFEAVSRHFEE